ncbi:uncharacterized protein [Parasteatoda tepidariorum]|uniref:uncharacterized protein n=1 Tax=Parasteatoda tepidariorum TaxID=114398 RepID=UPI0039BD60EE
MGKFADITQSDDDDQDEPIPPDLSGEYYQHRRDAMRILEANQFVCIDKLGSGAFGDVYKMIGFSGREVAVKVVALEVAKPNETEIWPKLSRSNIIPLLEYFSFNNPDVAIFVMPMHRDTLLHAVLDRHFLSQSSALDCIKSRLYDTLCGLTYLHSNEACHLDLKADNVLISHDHKAVICDFSFLAPTTKAIPRSELGLPPVYRPPEACPSLGSGAAIEGKGYDLWAFGMMVLEIFTNQALGGTSSNAGNWERDIYPVLFNILQSESFKSSICGMFSETGVSDGQVKLALNFIHTFLMPDRRERWNATKASDHCFFKSGRQIGAGPHTKWIHFVNPNIEEHQMISLNRNQGVKREAEMSLKPPSAKRANIESEETTEKIQQKECEKCKYIKVLVEKIENLKKEVVVLEQKNACSEQKVGELKKFLEIDEFEKRKAPVPRKIMISTSTQTTNSLETTVVENDLPEHITSDNITIQNDTFVSWVRKKLNACKNRILRFSFK